MKLILINPGGSKLFIVKLTKDITGLSLKEAKTLIDCAPSVIKESEDLKELRSLKKQFEGVGARMEIVMNSTKVPSFKQRAIIQAFEEELAHLSVCPDINAKQHVGELNPVSNILGPNSHDPILNEEESGKMEDILCQIYTFLRDL
jgi:hypothetical protein